jgi:hypothetical protein
VYILTGLWTGWNGFDFEYHQEFIPCRLPRLNHAAIYPLAFCLRGKATSCNGDHFSPLLTAERGPDELPPSPLPGAVSLLPPSTPPPVVYPHSTCIWGQSRSFVATNTLGWFTYASGMQSAIQQQSSLERCYLIMQPHYSALFKMRAVTSPLQVLHVKRSAGNFTLGAPKEKRCLIPTKPNIMFFFFSMAQQPLVGQGLLIIEASRSHSDTPH